jgi:stage II sporulation protein GA (sporulation sigma-E factor processing peptidase)
MTVYLDVVFIENLIMNLVIILSEAAVLNSLNNFPKKIIASLVLSFFYVVTLFYPVISKLHILFGILAVKISFNSHSIKFIFKQTLLFYFISFVFGGLSFAMVNLFNNGKFTILDGVLVANFSVFKVFLCGVLGAFMVFNFLKNKKKHIFKEIIVGLEQREAKLKVLLDTGNLLKEPYTGKSVIIVEKDALKEVLDEKLILNFQDIINRKKRNTNWNVYDSL